jgi:hypothetical protein
MFSRRQLSADGIEMTFALNHLAYFSLTSLLMPSLRAAERARIVNVASDAHFGIELDFEVLQIEPHLADGGDAVLVLPDLGDDSVHDRGGRHWAIVGETVRMKTQAR